MLWAAGLHKPEILRHPSCPARILEEVAVPALDCAQDPGLDARAALRHPLCPTPLLLRAVRSKRYALIAAAAACPDLPAELAAEVEKMVAMDPRDLLAVANLEEAKRLARAGWNVEQA